VEAGYIYNSSNHTLEHYYQQPPDYNSDTYQAKEIFLENLSDCRFSYWDGSSWQTSWDQNRGELPRMIKINFKFADETKEQEFLVNVPVSS
jgi:hypothetical protein